MFKELAESSVEPPSDVCKECGTPKQIGCSHLTKLNNSEISDTSAQIARERLLEPFHLPTHAEIMKAFPSYDDWHKFWKKNHIFELWNKEFVNALVDYLADRVAKLGKLRIVEIGAGDGKLSRFIELVAQEKGLDADFEMIMPTDSNKWVLNDNISVVKESYEDAINMFRPNIVLSSWMPPGQDWTKTIRQFDCVKEYILIGDCTNCGDLEQTWGNFNFEEPFHVDSFEREVLLDLHRLQISRGDVFAHHNVLGTNKTHPYSWTVSFKRV